MSENKDLEKFKEKLYNTNQHFKEGKLDIIELLDNKKVTVKSKYGTHIVSRGDLVSGLGVGIKSAQDKTQYIINVFKEVHGDTYDYSLVEYKAIKSKVKIVCSIHGIFEQVPDSHKKGIGCKKCGKSKMMPTKEFALLKLKENNFDNSKEFKLLDFSGNKTKVEVVCQADHVYTTNIYSRLKWRYGCLECHKKYLYISNNVGDEDAKNIACTVYILKFTNENEVFFKVGLSKNFRKRLVEFRSKTPYKVEVFRTFETTLDDAFIQEQRYLETYKHFKYKPLINFGGSTECLSENPINLDNWQYEHYYKITENE